MGLNLLTNLPMFAYTFQDMWRHRPLEEVLVFVGIRVAHTSFSPFTLHCGKETPKHSTLYATITTCIMQSTAYCCIHCDCNIEIYYVVYIISFPFVIQTFIYK